MRVLADVSDKQYFTKLARQIKMLSSECRVTDNGIYGVSQLKGKVVAKIIDDYLTSQGPVIYQLQVVDVKKVAGYYIARMEYVDADDDSLVSVSVCDSEADTLVCVAEVEY